MKLASLTSALALALTITACGKKAASPAGAGSGTAPAPPAAVDAASAAKVEAAKPDGAKPAAVVSKATRAEYKRHLQAGRTLAKSTKWPEAIAELEAALAAIPGDDRALGELSYAYMASGDHAKARKAGRAAVLAATDPKLKAAALYNLGRVEETDAPDKAAALYQESLALRPNQTVQKRLADLASRAAAAAGPRACATPMPEAELCACLRKTVVDNFEAGADIACTLEPTKVPGFSLARFDTSELHEEEIDVVAVGPGGVAVVGTLDTVYNPGMMGISEDWTLDAVREEALGDHTIVRFESTKSRVDSDMGVGEVEDETSKQLLVCVRDPKGGLPTCPLDVTTAYTYERDRIEGAEEDPEVADMQTKGLPIKDERTLTVTLLPEGVAQVRVERGRADDAGDKRLW